MPDERGFFDKLERQMRDVACDAAERAEKLPAGVGRGIARELKEVAKCAERAAKEAKQEKEKREDPR